MDGVADTMSKMNRKVKVGASSGGTTGVIVAIILGLLHAHLPPEALVSIPAFLTWAAHFLGSYAARNVQPATAETGFTVPVSDDSGRGKVEYKPVPEEEVDG